MWQCAAIHRARERARAHTRTYRAWRKYRVSTSTSEREREREIYFPFRQNVKCAIRMSTHSSQIPFSSYWKERAPEKESSARSRTRDTHTNTWNARAHTNCRRGRRRRRVLSTLRWGCMGARKCTQQSIDVLLAPMHSQHICGSCDYNQPTHLHICASSALSWCMCVCVRAIAVESARKQNKIESRQLLRDTRIGCLECCFESVAVNVRRHLCAKRDQRYDLLLSKRDLASNLKRIAFESNGKLFFVGGR